MTPSGSWLGSGGTVSAGIADLVTAVLAVEHRLTLIHYDSDFDIAAQVLDLDHRWVAERGSIS